MPTGRLRRSPHVGTAVAQLRRAGAGDERVELVAQCGNVADLRALGVRGVVEVDADAVAVRGHPPRVLGSDEHREVPVLLGTTAAWTRPAVQRRRTQIPFRVPVGPLRPVGADDPGDPDGQLRAVRGAQMQFRSGAQSHGAGGAVRDHRLDAAGSLNRRENRPSTSRA